MPQGTRRSKSSSPARRELVEQMNLAGREVSAASVLFHTALAARRGLGPAEEKALDVLLRKGPLSHSELGAETGLAPASVSDLIDRLEGHGLAERAPHPDDGRRILISANAERVHAELTPLFADWARSLEELYSAYSDAELRLIQDFLVKVADRQRAATDALPRQTREPSAP